MAMVNHPENEADRKGEKVCSKGRVKHSENSDLYFFDLELVNCRDKVIANEKPLLKKYRSLYSMRSCIFSQRDLRIG